jgi:hypothetical protein
MNIIASKSFLFKDFMDLYSRRPGGVRGSLPVPAALAGSGDKFGKECKGGKGFAGLASLFHSPGFQACPIYFD